MCVHLYSNIDAHTSVPWTFDAGMIIHVLKYSKSGTEAAFQVEYWKDAFTSCALSTPFISQRRHENRIILNLMVLNNEDMMTDFRRCSLEMHPEITEIKKWDVPINELENEPCTADSYII